MHLNCPILFVSFLRLDNIYAIANSTVLADMLIWLININVLLEYSMQDRKKGIFLH
jgi:hypothetical protein